ncbi:hypothetical protein SNEBB_005486 [Seison nebaliae]|nr:hypothetical protein SNEBB_005486 [Seison nebaliae]
MNNNTVLIKSQFSSFYTNHTTNGIVYNGILPPLPSRRPCPTPEQIDTSTRHRSFKPFHHKVIIKTESLPIIHHKRKFNKRENEKRKILPKIKIRNVKKEKRLISREKKLSHLSESSTDISKSLNNLKKIEELRKLQKSFDIYYVNKDRKLLNDKLISQMKNEGDFNLSKVQEISRESSPNNDEMEEIHNKEYQLKLMKDLKEFSQQNLRSVQTNYKNTLPTERS